MSIGLRTLVLNANYMPVSIFPLHTIPAEDAITRVFNGTCHTVFAHDRKILTPSLKMHWPSVIARNSAKRVQGGVKLKAESLYYRDHGKCAYCERSLTLNSMTCDHVIPKKVGGDWSWTNLVAACSDCNTSKGHKMPEGRWKPRFQPFKPDYWQLLELRKLWPITVDDPNWLEFLGPWKSDVYVRI